jgi:hypothetical protein
MAKARDAASATRSAGETADDKPTEVSEVVLAEVEIPAAQWRGRETYALRNALVDLRKKIGVRSLASNGITIRVIAG